MKSQQPIRIALNLEGMLEEALAGKIVERVEESDKSQTGDLNLGGVKRKLEGRRRNMEENVTGRVRGIDRKMEEIVTGRAREIDRRKGGMLKEGEYSFLYQ